MVVQKQITVRTPAHGAMNDLTGMVTEIVKESGIQTGIVQIFTVGSTAAVGTIEVRARLAERPARGIGSPAAAQ